MAASIDATVGGASANSFATLAEAELYMETRLNASAWGSDNDLKTRALIEATRELNRLAYEGIKATAAQALNWPRWYAKDPDSAALQYPWFQPSIIPQRMKDACMELAFQFLNMGTTDLAAQDASQGVIRKKVDVLETEWASPYARTTGLARFPRVMELIRPLLVGTGYTTRLVRG